MPITFIATNTAVINGTAADEGIVANQNNAATVDTTVNGGSGKDLVYGDARDILLVRSDILNGSTSNFINIDNVRYWTTSEDPSFGDAGIPHATILLDASMDEAEHFRLSIGAGQTIEIDLDYQAFFSNGTNNTAIQILDAAGNLVASSSATSFESGLDAAGAAGYLRYTAPSAGNYFIRLTSSLQPVITTARSMVVNISVTGHAVSAASVPGADTLNGEAGDDILLGQGGSDTLNGGDGGDLLAGGSGADVLSGDAGSDDLLGGDGADNLSGGSDGDDLLGGDGADILSGGDGFDELVGGLGADYLLGGTNGDRYVFTGVADSPANGAFDAVADFASSSDQLVFRGFDPGRVFIQTVEGGAFVYFGAGYGGVVQVNGAIQSLDLASDLATPVSTYLYGRDAVADTLIGGSGSDIMLGFAGADSIQGGLGSDQLYGGGGGDTFRYLAANETTLTGFDVIADFTSGSDRLDIAALVTAGATNLSLARFGGSTFVYFGRPGQSQFDGVIQAIGDVQPSDLLLGGGAVNFTIYGSSAGEALLGSGRSDLILAAGGADTITGGFGGDSLFGGGGADRFLYTGLLDSTVAAYDTIQDFQSGSDKIDLRGVATSVFLSSFGDATFVYFSPNAGGTFDGLIVVQAAITQDDVLVTGESGAPEEALTAPLAVELAAPAFGGAAALDLDLMLMASGQGIFDCALA